jgi:RNA polymerase sigma factor (sigma-70 family)
MMISDSLIEACIKNDRKGQKKLYELLLPYLTNLCYRYLHNTHYLDDAVQESFIRLFKYIHQFDPSKGTMKAWAGKIAIHCSLEYNRKEKPDVSLDTAAAKQLSIPASAVEQLSADHIMEVLKKIPTEHREVFMLHCIDGYSHQEIGQMLSIDEGNSRKRLSRAREALKELLQPMEPKKNEVVPNSSVA